MQGRLRPQRADAHIAAGGDHKASGCGIFPQSNAAGVLMRGQRPGLVAVVIIHDGDLVVVLAHLKLAAPDLRVAFQPRRRAGAQCRRVQAGCAVARVQDAGEQGAAVAVLHHRGQRGRVVGAVVGLEEAGPAGAGVAHAQLVSRVGDADADKPVLGDPHPFYAVGTHHQWLVVGGAKEVYRGIGGGVAEQRPVVAGGPDAVLIPVAGRQLDVHHVHIAVVVHIAGGIVDCTWRARSRRSYAGRCQPHQCQQTCQRENTYRLHGYLLHGMVVVGNRSVKCSCLHILQDCLKSVASGLRKSTLLVTPALAPLACHMAASSSTSEVSLVSRCPTTETPRGRS